MSLIFFAIIFFLLGICIGSFSGVLMHENIRHLSFWTRRSHCAKCGKTLHWYELIPLVSYMIQGGKCRGCGSLIPGWVFRIEWIMGIVWMIFGTILVSLGLSTSLIVMHLILLSCLVIVAIEDMRTMTIPDRLSVPMIGIAFLCISYARLYGESDLLPLVRWSLLGGLVGMIFYCLQIVTPALGHAISKKHYSYIPSILLAPVFFPFWLAIKVMFGEKQADKWLPSLTKIDALPTWVGGGDIRLGIFVGMIVGPLYFWWVIGIGYCFGVLLFSMARIFTKKHQTYIPVAPLLLVGVCGTWLLLLLGNTILFGL